MNTYSVGYSSNGVWTFLCVQDISIYSVLEWAKATIQPRGISVAIVEDVVEDDTTDDRSWIQRFRARRLPT